MRQIGSGATGAAAADLAHSKSSPNLTRWSAFFLADKDPCPLTEGAGATRSTAAPSGDQLKQISARAAPHEPC